VTIPRRGRDCSALMIVAAMPIITGSSRHQKPTSQ
jgi:hypothetical protein